MKLRGFIGALLGLAGLNRVPAFKPAVTCSTLAVESRTLCGGQSITAAQICHSAVTTATLGAGSVPQFKLSDGAIDAEIKKSS